MSDNAPAKAVSVSPWHYDEPCTLCYAKSMQIVLNKQFVLLEPHSSFRFQCRLLIMTTFFEKAVFAQK